MIDERSEDGRVDSERRGVYGEVMPTRLAKEYKSANE